MKKLFVVLVFCLNAAVLNAQSVLITVELVDNNRIEKWLAENHPTYEFIDSRAIAEVGESDLRALRSAGYTIEVIDHSPWSDSYYLSEVPVELESTVPGEIIWQGGGISLIEVPQGLETQMYKMPLRFQPLRKKQLPARFWQQILTKMVSLRAVRWDPFIQNIVDQVSTDSITAYIQRLQDFKTRLAVRDSSYAASEWLRQKFSAWGLTSAFDSFYVATGWPGPGYERNVIATLPGSVVPSRTLIIGGHHDAVVWYDTAVAVRNAPGADDNASGTVAAMEAARIFRGYSWDPTIQFITWGAEELGLIGSYHYAERADSLDLDIGAVLNFDMIGYMDDSNLDCIIQRRSSAPLWLSDLFYEAGQTYVSPLEIYIVTSGGGSDWYPFAVHGFPAVGAAERAGTHYNPQYHDTTDVLSTMTPSLYTSIVKTGVAALAVLAIYPGPVEDLLARDLGNGSDVQLSWTSSPETDVVGYRICWGLQSEMYEDSLFLSGAASHIDTIAGLLSDSTYYFTVRAIDADDNPSYASPEVTCTPRLVPFAPAGIVATPISSGIRVDWLPSEELDLAGYRLYRRLNESPTYDSLNTVLLTDTTYTNHPLSGADRYYYALRAFDLAGNYSDLSDEAYGRPITLDQGILIVDETIDGTNPPDSLQDAFYDYIMSNYIHSTYEYGSPETAPVFADFVPYSTILWHGDDYTQQYADEHISDFIEYFDVGGNIWFVGWRPTAGLEGVTAYPFNFSPGSFMYDYFGISHVEITTPADSFQAAQGSLGYPDLDVDTLKVPYAIWNGVLRHIEALTPTASAEVIYAMDMRNNNSPYEGAVCGVRFLGYDCNTVFFAFPLYFMDQNHARAAAEKVMNDFGEVGVEELPRVTPGLTGIALQQNIPNPFHEQTVVNYQLSSAGHVLIRVYNIAGQLVNTLVDAHQGAGNYNVTWFGTDRGGRRVSNGVYFCRLQFEDHTAMRKLIKLR